MNDVERDLRDLLTDKGSSVDVRVLAPEAVLRRGHRRQVGTVIASAVTCLVVVSAAVAAVARLSNPSTTVPAIPNGYAERMATIQGVTITAPAGWALVDDWPLAAVLPTESQTCSFSATGIPVSPGGATNGDPGSPQAVPGASASPTQSCTTTQEGVLAGLPIVQLANFEPPLAQTVCGLGGDPSTRLALTGNEAILYVAQGVDPRSLASVEGPMPTSIDRSAAPVDDVCGRGWYVGGTVGNASYFAFAGFGPDATEADRDAAFDAYEGLQFDGDAASAFPQAGPGYVIAAGVDAGQAWRIEAGFEHLAGSTPKIVATLFTASDQEPSTFAPSATTEPIPGWGAIGLGDMTRYIEMGTASSRVTAIDIEASDGSSSPAALLSWPESLRPYDADPRTLEGSIWYAIVPENGTPHPTLMETASNPTSTPTALDYRIEGDTIVATGNDLGHDWEMRLENDRMIPTVDGTQEGSYALPKQGGFQLDVVGGTFLISRQPNDIGGVTVTADASGDQPIADGRWMPAGLDDNSGRVWLVLLAGEGTGYLKAQNQFPIAVSWPTSTPPQPGQVLSAGSDDSLSWALRWTDQNCPVMDVVYAVHEGDTGVGECAIPFDGSDPFIGGFYGTTEAAVIITGPANMLCTVDDPTGQVPGGLSGATVAPVGRWAHTGSCIVTIPVGDRVTVHLTDQDSNPILGQLGVIVITAKRGSLTIG